MSMNDVVRNKVYKVHGVEGTVRGGRAKEGGRQLAVDLILHELNDMRVTTIMSFEGGAKAITLQRLEALGWDPTSTDPTFPGVSKNEADCVAKPRVWDGVERIEFEIRTGGGGSFQFREELTDDDMAALAAEMRTLAADLKATPSTPGGYPADWDQKGKPAQPPAGGAPRTGGGVRL